MLTRQSLVKLNRHSVLTKRTARFSSLSQKHQQLHDDDKQYILGTYARSSLAFERGEGSQLFDFDGRRYLDLAGGIAVNALGHSHPAWQTAVNEQADQLTHVSNLFHTEPPVELARRLIHAANGMDKVFFCNSGAEANEAALKFARKYHYKNGENRPRTVTLEQSFHGRTMGSLSLTAKPQIQEAFRPMLPDIDHIALNDVDAAHSCITEDVGMVLVEPIQGEGGCNVASPEFLQELRKICTDRGALLVVDEVQSGLGRTGRMFAHELAGPDFVPDMMTLAKPLAGGLPIGATLVGQHVADNIDFGDHGSTFAGNPLCTHVGCAVFDTIAADGFLDHVRAMGDRIVSGLQHLAEVDTPLIGDVRSAGGLLIGFDIAQNDQGVTAGTVMQKCADRGLVVLTAGANAVRLAPPLVITEQEVDEALNIMRETFLELNSESL